MANYVYIPLISIQCKYVIVHGHDLYHVFMDNYPCKRKYTWGGGGLCPTHACTIKQKVTSLVTSVVVRSSTIIDSHPC